MRDVAARRNSRVALALAALACTLSVVGVTPADAVHVVKRALTAGNADAVDGISASRTPRAGRLLPLGGDGHFPSSVLPSTRGPRGPRGAQGPQGPQGPPGVALVRVASGASTQLSPTNGVATEVARIDNLPAGAWLVQWIATVDYGGSAVIDVRCYVTIAGTTRALADTTVGVNPGAARAQVLSSFDGVTLDGTGSARLLCDVSPSTTGQVHVDDQRIAAIRADSLG